MVYRRLIPSIMMKIKMCITIFMRGRLTILTTGEGHLLLSGHFLCDVAKYQVFLLAEKQRAFFLGCKKTVYHGNYTSVDHWDMYGNYITEDTYGKLAEQYYADLQKKEASILWIECQHLEDLSKEEIYNLLKSSMDSFSLANI